jgi:hypothetical protein
MVTLILACHLTLGHMLLCRLPAGGKVYKVVVDTGSNVTSFVHPRPLWLTLSNGKHMKIKPRHAVIALTQYNDVADARHRIDGMIGQDVLSKFRRISIDYRPGGVTLVTLVTGQRIPNRGKHRRLASPHVLLGLFRSAATPRPAREPDRHVIALTSLLGIKSPKIPFPIIDASAGV